MLIDFSCWLRKCKTDISFLGPVGCALWDGTTSELILVERHSNRICNAQSTFLRVKGRESETCSTVTRQKLSGRAAAGE